MTTHNCPAGCGIQVPSRLYACRTDWARLPDHIRTAVEEGNRRGRWSEPHIASMCAARQWYQDNPRGDTA